MVLEEIEMGIKGLTDGLSGLAQNPIATGLGGAAVGLGVGGAIAAVGRKSKKRRTKGHRKKSSKSRKKAGKRRRYTPHTAGKGKDRSTRRIRHTKTGQPYVILNSGKARFISKKSAKASRRRKGGRY